MNEVEHESEDKISLVDLTTQRVKLQDKLDTKIAKVIQHGKFILGPEVRELETRLADFAGAAHVVTCGSGTGALTLSLLALGLQPNDAVLVPDLSFVATVEPVVLLGGVPIFVDVEPQHLTIDASLIDAGVTAAEKAGYRAVGIIAVDIYGHPADYDALNEVASRHKLWILGDAAQSFGGSFGGRRVGSLARVTTTSFFPSKPLGCYDDGGAVLTEDEGLAMILRLQRQHDLNETKTNGLCIGLNSRLDTIHAAVLLCKLDLLAEERKKRETLEKSQRGTPTYCKVWSKCRLYARVHKQLGQPTQYGRSIVMLLNSIWQTMALPLLYTTPCHSTNNPGISSFQ